MKIIIVTNMYPSEGDVSWRGSFVKEQVEAYLEQNKSEKIDIFHIKGKVSGGSNYNYVRLLPRLLYKLTFGGYDVVHCHHAFCVLLCIPWFYRLTYTVHEGELNNTSWRSKIIKLAIHLAKVPIFVSKKEYEESRKYHKQFLPCGVNFEIFNPKTNKDALRKYLQIPSDKKAILFPADPNRPEKNAHLLHEAEHLAIDENQPWHFIYGGRIPKNDMPKWMAAVDLVVSIGKFESDGMVIKEAMACNTPVISTDVGNSRLYIGDCSGLIVQPTSISIYEAIKEVLNEKTKFHDGRRYLKSLGQDIRSVTESLRKIYATQSSNR